MSSENRLFTMNPYQETTADNFNDLQDNWTVAWELDGSTLAPTTAWAGGTVYYGQFTFTNVNPFITVLDNSRDWRNRILDIRAVFVTAANELPKGVNYDPNLAGGLWGWNVMWTGSGATPANPPVAAGVGSCIWDVGLTSRRIFAASVAGGVAAQGDLVEWNGTGGVDYGMIYVIQGPDAS